MLKIIISGGQNGADVGGLIAAKKAGFETGGFMPKGFKTLNGPKPQYKELYNAVEHSSPSYPPRTFANVKMADGTIRFAYDFNSSGEKCTLKAILQYNKSYIDVDIMNPIPHQQVVDWMKDKKIINIAGNSEKTYMGMTDFVVEYLEEVFNLLNEQ